MTWNFRHPGRLRGEFLALRRNLSMRLWRFRAFRGFDRLQGELRRTSLHQPPAMSRIGGLREYGQHNPGRVVFVAINRLRTSLASGAVI